MKKGRYNLAPGTLILIDRGERHEMSGDELPRGRR